MSTLIQRKAARIAAADIQTFAIQGIERALAARCAVTELEPDQLQQVSGGAVKPKEVFVLSGARPPFPDPLGKDPFISRD